MPGIVDAFRSVAIAIHRHRLEPEYEFLDLDDGMEVASAFFVCVRCKKTFKPGTSVCEWIPYVPTGRRTSGYYPDARP